MMRQWERVKAQYPDTLLLFRMGDFYELFEDDAVIAARELEIVLTKRKDENTTPFCGVPYHAAERYIAQLVAKGYRVAICEQVEDPKYSRGLVKREVVRVLSPGTVIEDSFLNSVGSAHGNTGTGNNFLAAIVSNAEYSRFGLALLDVSTGEFLAGELEPGGGRLETNNRSQPCEPTSNLQPPASVVDQTPEAADAAASRWANLREELLRFAPSEVLVPQKLRECAGFLEFLSTLQLRTTAFDPSGFDDPPTKLLRQFKTASLRGFGLEEYSLAQEAASLALDYLGETQLGALGHIRRISLLSTGEWMLLDNATRRNLELAQSLRDGSTRGTLLGLLDETRTGAGGRLLKKWILQPLLQKDRIEKRQEAVAEFLGNVLLRRDVRDLLKSVGDIERLVSRAVTGQGNARDLVALRNALQTLPALESALSECVASSIDKVRAHLNPAPELLQVLESAIADEPPATLNDGGLIREGYDQTLDETRIAAREGKSWIAQLEESERIATGIRSLKVGFNNVFGYYIEITKAQAGNAPADYTRKQTTANAERFVTPELKEKEALILGAEERSKEVEKRLFGLVRNQVAGQAGVLLDTARALAHLDVYASFAEVASRRDYARPEIHDEPILDIRSGRHPVVEALASEPFVPNDCVMDVEAQQVLIITGPNASGKSTFLRQVALIVLMAQVGSFVPAREAKIGLTDRIFTRVGAQDDLATGQSTFTVEMNETANILNNATPRSLVILDEVGRGTSTYDGLSIAWAVAEYLHELGPKTLFATHYHHLNELEERLPRVRNYRIAVKEDGDHIIFLRRIIRGGTDRSFGIQVARLAGLPTPVISRAKELLNIFSQERLRGETANIERPTSNIEHRTTNLFEQSTPAPPHPVLEELKTLDVDNLTPMEAIVKLQELRKKAL
jgi:DNA mismatch repair protein MutS